MPNTYKHGFTLVELLIVSVVIAILASISIVASNGIQNRAKNVATQNLTAAQNRRDQESAVSLDEEYSSLTIYQQAYQASARMIKIADEMLQTGIGLI